MFIHFNPIILIPEEVIQKKKNKLFTKHFLLKKNMVQITKSNSV